MDKTMPVSLALEVADDAACDGGEFDSADRWRALLVLAAQVRADRDLSTTERRVA